MGQKVHPEALRVGYIHDWKSTWFNEKEFSDYLLEDIQHPRPHREQARPRRPVDDHDQEEQERGRGQHPHGPAGDRDRQVRLRGGRSAQGAPPDDRQGREGEHPRDQAARARREAGGPVDRRAAPEPRGLPARDEARAHQRDALGRQGREDPGLRPPRRRGDGAHRGLLGRPRAAAHAARRHRLRLLRGAHHLRPHRREGVDQQGRDHAQGLRAGPAPSSRRRRPWAGRRRPRSRRRSRTGWPRRRRGRWRRRSRPRRPRVAAARAAVAAAGPRGGRL